MKVISILLLGGIILLDVLLIPHHPENREWYQLPLGLLSLIVLVLLLSVWLIRRKRN